MSETRTVAYVDGFNLYFGLRAAELDDCRWLDLRGLCSSFLKPGQRLILVRYFTTRVRNNKPAASRQATYLDALNAMGSVEIDLGSFISKEVTCRGCGRTWPKPEEKGTDVNIAVRLLNDAHDDLFDVAIVVSGDSDLAPAVKSIHERHPDKIVLVAAPPKRWSAELSRAAHHTIRIWPKRIRKHLLPDPVVTSTGVELRAPKGWTPS